MKVMLFIIFITDFCFSQYYWPMVGNSGSEPVKRINSNFGDYRNTNRFHLGVDVQETDNSMIYPVTDAEVITDPYYNGTSYMVTVRHGIWDDYSEDWLIQFDIYSVYLHLITIEPISQGDVFIPQLDPMADGGNLEDGHLHFNIVEDLNGTNIDPNDDYAINPLTEVGWADYNEEDLYYPTLHNLYLETNADVEVLNYPNNYDSRYFENDPSPFTRILYENQPSDQHPKVLISNIISSDRLRMIIQATDRLNNGTGLTPNVITVLLDEKGYSVYNHVIFLEIQDAEQPNGRVPAEIVYNTDPPLETIFNTDQQYYRLYKHPTNTKTLPDPYQTVHTPIDLYDAEEGMHRVQITLKGERYFENNQPSAKQITRIFCYYVLKNYNGYMDLSQSSWQL